MEEQSPLLLSKAFPVPMSLRSHERTKRRVNRAFSLINNNPSSRRRTEHVQRFATEEERDRHIARHDLAAAHGISGNASRHARLAVSTCVYRLRDLGHREPEDEGKNFAA